MARKILDYNPVIEGDILTYGKEPERFTIIEYDGVEKDKYYISTYGRVFNKKTKHEFTSLISESRDKLYVQIPSINGTHRKNIYLHTLVANHFLKKTKKDIRNRNNCVKFIDGNSYNVFIWNLKWDNLTNLRAKPNVKLSYDLICQICLLLEKGYSINDIVEKYDLKYNIVYNIATKRTWTDVSCNFKIKYKKKERRVC